MQTPAPIAINILTGFLGAGKTTLLNRLVKEATLANAVVLINEFGEIALDHLLVEGVEGEMVALSSGCLCCTIRGELVGALEDLLRRRDNGRIRPFDRLLIETTGLADPAPILNTLMLHPYLSRRFTIDAVVTVVDAVNGAATLDTHEEARRQVAMADRLVLTKTDIAEAASVASLDARLRELNPTASLVTPEREKLDGHALLHAGLYAPNEKIPDVARWLNAEMLLARKDDEEEAKARDGHEHHHVHSQGPHPHEEDPNRHSERIRAFCLASEKPVKAAALDLFLQLLRAIEPARLLRLKGIVALAERPDEPLIVHGVQEVVHEPVRLSRWPDADRRTRLVLILEGGEESEIRKLWGAFSADTPHLDAPDQEALLDNPLKATVGRLLA
ncbi:MAG: GTP-binding protein [Hyphomicrobiales bacterium]|nr:GTP-binding protein [Hyphomicrobiales bacterium]